MNRQAGPSIVLSVLIVCFFAVALFRRDPPGETRGHPRAVSGTAPGRPEPTSPSPSADPAPGVVKLTHLPVPPPAKSSRVSSNKKMIAGTVASRSPSTSGAAAKMIPAMQRVEGRDDGPNLPVRSQGLSSPVTVSASTRSDQPPIRPSAVQSDGQAKVPRGPGSPFTQVESNETIRDVAVRVYGTPDRVEILWRANQDTLPRRDTPLSAGMLLRTPSLR